MVGVPGKRPVMEAYAVVATGGKQYLVQANDTLKVERLPGEPGTKIDLGPVLAISDGTTLKVGTPDVSGVKVTATIVKQVRGVKVVNFKQKRRKGYRRKVGHRQELTALKVDSIG